MHMTPQYLHNQAGTKTAAPDPHYGLQIAVIHEEALPLEWATQVTRRAVRLIGSCAVRTAQWSVKSLDDPVRMEAATEAAVTADILVVVVSGDRPFPLKIDRWIDAWLPRRLERAGALVAVIGARHKPGAFARRIREYLRDVASLAHLDFLVREPSLPGAHAHSTEAGMPQAAQVPKHIQSPNRFHTSTSRAA